MKSTRSPWLVTTLALLALVPLAGWATCDSEPGDENSYGNESRGEAQQEEMIGDVIRDSER